ncbi:hypothetical protein MRX96_042190 [Rhipicephalus microplus]
MCTEPTDVPSTTDFDSGAANGSVDVKSVRAASPVRAPFYVSQFTLLLTLPPSELLDNTGTDEPDDGAFDVFLDAPAMDIPQDHSMLLAQQVRALRATLCSAPTPDS